MPNILQAHSSYVVTDPKGEILEKSGHFLKEQKGYTLRVLNLDNKSRSDGYNPFVYIHPEREGYDERTLMLIEAIILNTDGGEKRNSSDPFWEKAERLFLQAIFFFTCDGFPIQERNMNTVLDLIGMLQIGEEEDDLNSDLDLFARVFAKRFGEDHIGVQQYNEFRSKASGKTAKSIVISAVARLAPFRTSAVRRIFSYDSMNLEMLGEQKMVIFVVVPPTDNTFNFIAGMLFTQMFQELQYCAAEKYKHKGQRLPVPVRFILDEFANTCKIPNFIKILAYARSFGIGIVPILQSLEQIKTMYKDEWGVVVDNCSARLFREHIPHGHT
jgi:type IV secretion system protein VirD4